MILSKCSVCNSKKLKFPTEESRGLLRSLRIRTPFNQVPFLGSIFFKKYNMNEIKNKFSLEGNKFMPEMHL